MASLSDLEIIHLLDNISKHVNRYFCILILLFGTIGNLLNCLVLSRPTLRSNPCSFLFLCSSIANIISIIFGLTTRLLAGWNLDFTLANSSLCKFRVYIMFVSRTIAFWLIALATVDRWYSSCNQQQRRKFSSLRNAQRGTMVIIICSSILYCQLLYCYDANLVNAPLQCYGKTVTCRLLTDITYAFITVLCPLTIMSIYGIRTISNIRQTYSAVIFKRKVVHNIPRSRSTPTMTFAQQERWRKIDRYLRLVLFRQVILLALLTLPQVIEKLYTTITIYRTKSQLHMAVDSFVYNIVLLLTFVASGSPFYIYTLSGGSIFRTTFFNLLQPMYSKMTCR